MYVQINKNTSKSGKTYKSVLLCHKYRENGKIKTRVISSLTHLPENVITAIKNTLHKPEGQMVAVNDIVVEKSIDYGFSFVLIALLDRLRISQVFDTLMLEQAALVKLMIIGKIITRGSKLSIYNWIRRNQPIAMQLGLDVKTLKLDDLYSTLSDLSNLQPKIEHKWAIYHKNREEIFLYDITSTYFEGVQNELARFGYNRDGKHGKMQINIGLVTNKEGFPLKVQVFEGNVNDYKTVAEQIHSLKQEFGANHIIFVGDRGMRIRYNLEQMNQAQREGVDYITGLTRLEIEQLAHTGIIQLDLFAKELVEVQDNGLRYILSVNPELERESTAKRGELRNRFEGMLSEIQCAYKKKRAHFQENLQKLQDGHKNKKLVTHFTDKQIDKYKFDVTVLMRKYNMTGFYDITIDKQKFDVQFNWESYQNTCNMDGKYVIATTVPANKMNKEEVREQYKSLQHVEHAFRDMKTTNLDIRPVFHVNGDTTRGHVLLSMFSYCIIKEIETKIFPFLKSFNSINKEQFSFRDIEEELKLIKLNILRLGGEYREIKITELTTVQEQILKLLDIDEKKLNLKQK